MKSYDIKYVNLSPNPDPEYARSGDSGFDLRAWITEKEGTQYPYNKEPKIVLKPLERVLIHTGLYFDIPYGCEMQIRPRSGMSLKRGLGVLNSPATIDATYTGEIGIIVVNLSNDNIEIMNGERIAQGVICPVITEITGAKLTKVDKIEKETERGSGGFGHTGEN